MTKVQRLAAALLIIISMSMVIDDALITMSVKSFVSISYAVYMILAVGIIGLIGGILLGVDLYAGGIIAIISGVLGTILTQMAGLIYYYEVMISMPLNFYFLPYLLTVSAGIIGIVAGKDTKTS